MSWRERLREAAYTGPDGTRQTFAYEDLRQSIATRRTAFEFVGVDGAYIQDNGVGPRRFPLRAFFSGPDYDLEVAAFQSLLLQSGTGKLEHPAYGTHDCAPVGTITQRDDLKSGANQAVLEVTFLVVGSETFPAQSAAHLPTRIDAGVQTYGADAAASYAASDPRPSRSTVTGALEAVRTTLGSLAEATQGAQREFQRRDAAINGAIGLLVATPLDLAQQLIALAHAPARTGAIVRARLDGYRNLLEAMVQGAGSAPQSLLPERRRLAESSFLLADLVASASVTGAVLAATDPTDPASQLRTRANAEDAAQSLGELAARWVNYRELRYRELGLLDAGVVQQRVTTLVSLSQKYLRQAAFGLLVERRIVLDRARTLIDLAAELFGDSWESQIDVLVEHNELTSNEVLELPRGRTIVYDA